MARIVSFTPIARGDDRVHGPVNCGFKIIDVEGQRLLQLDTYGSADRMITGKVSQSIQLDGDGAAELLKLLRQAFPHLDRSGT